MLLNSFPMRLLATVVMASAISAAMPRNLSFLEAPRALATVPTTVFCPPTLASGHWSGQWTSTANRGAGGTIEANLTATGGGSVSGTVTITGTPFFSSASVQGSLTNCQFVAGLVFAPGYTATYHNQLLQDSTGYNVTEFSTGDYTFAATNDTGFWTLNLDQSNFWIGLPTDYRQDGATWSVDQLGGCTGCTIGGAGCLLTDVTNVLAYLGVSAVDDNGVPKALDPGAFNKAMKDAGWPDGFLKPKYEKAVLPNQQFMPAGNAIATDATTYQLGVLRDLQHGLPVIIGLNVRQNADGTWLQHFVVVTGVTGSSFYIHDPQQNPSWTNGSTLSMSDLRQSHQWWTVNHRTLAITDDPVALLLTDSAGRRTGVDPITGQILSEIPSSAYGTMGAINDDLAGLNPIPGVMTLSLEDPPPGTYSLRVENTSGGPFTVDGWSSSPNNPPTLLPEVQGSGSPGSGGNWALSIDSTGNATLTLTFSAVGGIAEPPDLTVQPATASRPADHTRQRVVGGSLAFAVLSVAGASIWYVRRSRGGASQQKPTDPA